MPNSIEVFRPKPVDPNMANKALEFGVSPRLVPNARGAIHQYFCAVDRTLLFSQDVLTRPLPS